MLIFFSALRNMLPEPFEFKLGKLIDTLWLKKKIREAGVPPRIICVLLWNIDYMMAV